MAFFRYVFEAFADDHHPFRVASTAASSRIILALNLQQFDCQQLFPMQATNAQLTDEHRANIRETVIDQLAPLRNFPKAHTYPGQMAVEPYSPGSAQAGRHSHEIRRSIDHRRSADRCPRYPLTAFSAPGTPMTPFGANSPWSPTTQIALAASKGSTDSDPARLSQEQLIANAASSAFFAPTPLASRAAEASNSAMTSLLKPSTQQAGSQRATELANAAASSFFAPANLRQQQPKQQPQQQHHLGANTQASPMHRPTHPPLHGNSPTGAVKPHYSRAMRGNFEQPQARARASFEQTRSRRSFEQPRGSSSSSFNLPLEPALCNCMPGIQSAKLGWTAFQSSQRSRQIL